MPKLAGDAYVYFDDKVYAPGDPLPKELKHLSDEPDAVADDASSSAGLGDPEGADLEIEKLNVPQLRKALDQKKVAYEDGDRKDKLVQLLKAAQ